MVHAPGNDNHETATAALEKLAAELSARGFETALAAPADRLPFLNVRNPQQGRLTEMILADQGCFWWSWAEKIGKVTDVGEAAVAISRVLSFGSSST